MDNVKTDCTSGNMNFRDASGNIICTIDSANRALTVPSGSTLTISGSLTAATYNTSTTHLVGGASGTAGDLSIFPATSSKGKLLVTKADNTNDDTTTVTVALQGGAYTYTVPDAGGSASFMLARGTNTLAGATGTNILALTDNLASAYAIKESSNAYLTFVTTDGSESVDVSKRLRVTDGVASGDSRIVGGMAFSDVAASDTVTAATSNNSFTSFAQTYSIPANTLKAGTLVRIRAQVTVNDASGSDTLTCNIRLGGTSLVASTAVNPGAVTDHHILEFHFVSRAAPSGTSSCAGYGQWYTNTGGTMATASAILAPANFATNGALVVDVQAKWSSNTSNTSARLEVLNVEII